MSEGKEYPTKLNVAGDYNVQNVLIAAMVAHHCGTSREEIAEKIPLIHPVAGRFEEVISDPFSVVIDFAVTPGALESILHYAKKVAEGNVRIVFGCTGGNHDHSKRPQMGEVATRHADYVVLTEDESYGEAIENIFAEVYPTSKENVTMIPERREAIYYALDHAKPGDVVIITGMGALESRNDGTKEVAWSDKAIALEWKKTFIPSPRP